MLCYFLGNFLQRNFSGFLNFFNVNSVQFEFLCNLFLRDFCFCFPVHQKKNCFRFSFQVFQFPQRVSFCVACVIFKFISFNQSIKLNEFLFKKIIPKINSSIIRIVVRINFLSDQTFPRSSNNNNNRKGN